MVGGREGEELTDKTELLAYVDNSTMNVSVSVSQTDIASLSIGDEALVRLEEGREYHGIITQINPVSNSGGRTSITFTVTLTLQGDVSALSANMTATVLFGQEAEKGGRGK